jgi:hypothetical protein
VDARAVPLAVTLTRVVSRFRSPDVVTYDADVVVSLLFSPKKESRYPYWYAAKTMTTTIIQIGTPKNFFFRSSSIGIINLHAVRGDFQGGL